MTRAERFDDGMTVLRAVDVGLTSDETVVAPPHPAVYRRIPRALDATLVATGVVAERQVRPTGVR